MLGHLYQQQDCSAARALELVGERWSLLILRDAMFRGHRRFSEFSKTLEVAPNILTKRLQAFVEAGLMELTPAGDYLLTRKGLELKPVIVALTQWGDKWVRPGPVVFTAAGGKGDVGLAMLAADGTPLDVAEVKVRPSEAWAARQRS